MQATCPKCGNQTTHAVLSAEPSAAFQRILCGECGREWDFDKKVYDGTVQRAIESVRAHVQEAINLLPSDQPFGHPQRQALEEARETLLAMRSLDFDFEEVAQ